MISMRPVLEVHHPEGFSLWPTSDEPTGLLVLDGRLTPEQVGTAVHRLAELNDVDPEPGEERGPRPADPLGAFLHGLLTVDPYVTGGLYVTDSATGTVFEPGCCYGLEEWREWHQVADGSGVVWFGHDPWTTGEAPRAARLGRLVRLTQAPDDPDSPVIELPVDELRRLLAGAERDLCDFLGLVRPWAERQLPGHAAAVTRAIARALELEPAADEPATEEPATEEPAP